MTAAMRTPDLPQLKEGLTRILRPSGCQAVGIKARRPNPHESTFTSEIVDCCLGDAPPLTLLCKYGRDVPTPTGAPENDRGVRYEGKVYRKILAHTDCSVPYFYGSYDEPETRQQWLVLEYLGESQSVNKMVYRYPLSLAADWIGRFHSLHEASVSSPRFSFLTQYDEEYYRSWIRRASLLSESLREKAPWMAELCTAFHTQVADLLLSHPTVIHGEYYPQNVLIRDGTVYPIDWESAAVGAGEVDLAALTERWPEEEANACQRAYVESRWGGNAPRGFEKRLDAARLYFHLRWLANRRHFLPKSQWRIDLMYQCGRRLGIL